MQPGLQPHLCSVVNPTLKTTIKPRKCKYSFRHIRVGSVPLLIARVVFIVQLHKLFPSAEGESSAQVEPFCALELSKALDSLTLLIIFQ